MKVIVASFSKCGTKTMTKVLRELGYEVYDFTENYYMLRHDWNKIFISGGSTEDFRRMFENVDAVCDMPSCYFWDEIHKAFPDSKIIFCEREEEEWWRSFQKHMKPNNTTRFTRFIVPLSPTARSCSKFFGTMLKVIFGADVLNAAINSRPLNDVLMRMTYRRHNASVKQNAPKEKLLKMEFSQGWEPICEFLDKPVPDIPFPHVNKGHKLVKEMQSKFYTDINRELLVNGCAALALSCVVGAYAISSVLT